MRALITGATGFIGQALTARQENPIVVSRDPARAKKIFKDATCVAWDPLSGPLPAEALENVEAIFHLAGDPVASGRWTQAKKTRIRESRVIGTRNLVAGIKASADRPKVLISASAVGYYGDRGDELLAETAQPGHRLKNGASRPISPEVEFLCQVCEEWEQEAAKAGELGVRVVHARLGIVLGNGGGALAKMLPPFRMGLGGRLGSGKQWMPWVHLNDVVGLFLHAASHAEIDGPVNFTAPNPETNRDFTQTLAASLGRKAIFPVPAFAIRLLMGGFAEILLSSQRVVPQVAEKTSYKFLFPTLHMALEAILRPR